MAVYKEETKYTARLYNLIHI